MRVIIESVKGLGVTRCGQYGETGTHDIREASAVLFVACGFCQLKASYEGTWFSISWTESVKGLGVTWCGQAGITCNGKEKTPQDTPKRSQDNPKTPTRLPQTPKATPKPPRTPPGHTQTPPRPLQKPCKTLPLRADGLKRIPKGTLLGPF